MLVFNLRKYARRYAETDDGKWLNDFEWEKVPVVTISELPGDIIGMYSFGKIFVLDTNLEIIFSTYIHELRHRWQRVKHPWKFLAGKVYRPLIEKDADAETEKADKFIVQEL